MSLNTIIENYPDGIISRIHICVAHALGYSETSISVSPLMGSKGISDETLKLVVRDSKRIPVGVVLCSSLTAPDMISRGVSRSRDAKRVLGTTLGEIPLLPIKEFSIDQISCALFPYMVPLNSNRILRYIQRIRLRQQLLSWLGQLTIQTSREIHTSELDQTVRQPLEYILHLNRFDEEVNNFAKLALERLNTKQWKPINILMHGDLWSGNILLAPKLINQFWTNRFVVIDWPGSTVRGFPMFDLARITLSMKSPKRQVCQEIKRHANILKCSYVDLISYLLCAIGYIGQNIENFPVNRYIEMSQKCFSQIVSAVDLSQPHQATR